MSSKSKDQDKQGSTGKKPYSSPRLTNFGLVKELTTGGSGAMQEEMTIGDIMNPSRFP